MNDVQGTGRVRRLSRVERQGEAFPSGSPFELSDADAAAQGEHFGAARSQIEHDFAISHVLSTLAPHADRFIFYGGTALSRTILDGLRLSEDLDLLSVGPRAPVAAILDDAIRSGLERGFGRISATPWLSGARTDTSTCTLRIGDVRLRIQLIDGRDYAAWPLQTSTVRQRYAGLPDIELTTYTPAGFAGAKTVAWCDTTRNAPRDLYDLWALARAGHLTAEAARIYKRNGPSYDLPRRWAFPAQPPSPAEWLAALGHQCIPMVGPDEAFDTVVAAWEAASEAATS